MKTKLCALIILFSSVFVSCKDDKNTDPMDAVAQKKENNFKVTLNVVAKKDDTFSLFYTEDGSTDFTKVKPIWVEVKGSESAQDVVFNLPEDIVPTQLRLDFALNKEQEPIVINSFKMNYYDKFLEVPGDQFYIYFDPDLSKTIYNKETRTVTAVVKDGVKQIPSFYPNTKPLGEEISKLNK